MLDALGSRFLLLFTSFRGVIKLVIMKEIDELRKEMIYIKPPGAIFRCKLLYIAFPANAFL